MPIYAENARQKRVNLIVNRALASSSRTAFIGTTRSDFENIGTFLRNSLHAHHLGVIFDARTAPIARDTVLPVLESSGLHYTECLVPDPASGPSPVCSTPLGEWVADQFPTTPDALISVGGGTMTDTAKIAARTLDIPTTAIATAASMNGFTSSLAATLDDGVKLTRKVPPPRAVWSLTTILQDAPAQMTAAGLGDLLSKPISSADWRLSHLLNNAPWDQPVIDMLGTVTDLSTGVAEGIQRNQSDAWGQLFSALSLTGIAMQAATPGSQASGAEHLISHYFDMIAGSGAFGHTATHHGAQVAVGCMVALRAWTFAQNAFKKSRPFGPCPERVYSPGAREAWIDGHFRSVAPAIGRMHADKPVLKSDVDRRRALLHKNGAAVIRDAASQLPRDAWLHGELQKVGCPTRFHDIGVDVPLAIDCLRYAPWVRARYTIFHLLVECGWHDDFVREVRATLTD